MVKLVYKRLIIVTVYFILFTFTAIALYFIFRPKATCFDGKKNQNEQDVDCGGICERECNKIVAQDLVVGAMGSVPSGIVGKYDFYVEIANPNAIFGSRKFDYTINLMDPSGVQIATRDGTGFILPGENKYVIENNIEAASEPAALDFKIKNSDWVEFNDFYEKPDIQIVNKNYTQISSGTGFYQAMGLVKNKSPFDFEAIKIEVILRDPEGKVIALNSTQMRTVRAMEDRDFRVFWPNSFPGTVGNMEAQADVNIFDESNFVNRFYKTEKFQQY